MSSGSVTRRPGLWSYLSFNSHTRNRSTPTLPTRRSDRDPLEKPGRYSAGRLHESRSAMRDFQTSLMRQSSMSRFVKLGAIITFAFFVFFLIRPSERQRVESYVGSHAPFGSGAKRCKVPHDPSKPLLQFALMIDAGSTGSRIHVYRFNNCGPTPALEQEFFEMTAVKEGGSGLSSYDSDSEGAARSLDPLMKVAMKNVPNEYKKCTPIAVKATAGLRKLGPEKSEKILQAVRNRLETVYPFPVVSDEKGGVQVMDGKDEGVYAWITTNYLLGNIGSPDKTPTVAVFDLGGGSTQIVFEPAFAPPDALSDGDHKYALTFGGREFVLYQHSYLGYGLMEARNNIHRLITLDAFNRHGLEHLMGKSLANPCLPPGYSEDVIVALDPGHPLGESFNATMVGPSIASPLECRAVARKTLLKDASCAVQPCAFNGVHQPSLQKTFEHDEIYLFSYFYDRLKPLGMPTTFTLSEMERLTSHVCEGESSWGRFSNVKGALEELRGRAEHCLDLNYMMALLHTGYDIPLSREVNIAKKIHDNELGWCLGASLPLLEKESGWTCKIKAITR